MKKICKLSIVRAWHEKPFRCRRQNVRSQRNQNLRRDRTGQRRASDENDARGVFGIEKIKSRLELDWDSMRRRAVNNLSTARFTRPGSCPSEKIGPMLSQRRVQ